jgi:hypothetical protein
MALDGAARKFLRPSVAVRKSNIYARPGVFVSRSGTGLRSNRIVLGEIDLI